MLSLPNLKELYLEITSYNHHQEYDIGFMFTDLIDMYTQLDVLWLHSESRKLGINDIIERDLQYKKLYLHGFVFEEGTLRSLLKSCPKLEELTLRKVTTPENYTIPYLKGLKLKYLSVDYEYGSQYLMLNLFFPGTHLEMYKTLHTLRLKNFQGNNISDIVGIFSNLRHLFLRSCSVFHLEVGTLKTLEIIHSNVN